MALNLNPACRERLVDVAAQALESVEVAAGCLVALQSFGDLEAGDRALESAGRVRPELLKFVGERPFSQFIQEALAKEFYDRKFDREAPPVPLNSLDGYRDLRALGARLVQEFDALPSRYLFSVRLPHAVQNLFDVGTTFSERMSVVASANFKAPAPAHGHNALADILFPRGLPQASSQLLQIDLPGFVGIFSSTSTEDEVVSSLKSFFGMLAALDVVYVGLFAPGVAMDATDTTAEVYESRGREWKSTKDIRLPRAMLSTLARLYPTRHAGETAKECILQLQHVFTHRERCRKLLLAAEWLFNSYDDSDQLLSYVQAMVVLEILLGDKATSEAVGLGELLRNRCAYLIGRTHSERHNIIEKFKEIYTVRSSIVHAGKTKLSREEHVLFYTLRTYCPSSDPS